MKIRTKLYVSTAVTICLIVVLVFVIVQTSATIEKENERRAASRGTLQAISELDILTYEYLMHYEPRMEQQWRIRYASIAPLLDKARENSPEESMMVDRLSANSILINTTFNEVVASYEQTQKLIGEGVPQEKIDAAASESVFAAPLLIASQSMIQDASVLAEKNVADLLKAQALARDLTWIVALIILIGLGIISFTTVRSFTQSMNKLQEGTEAIGHGNLDFRIEEDGNDDELGVLSHSFNQMTSDLRKISALKVDLEREIAARKLAEDQLLVKIEELKKTNEELTSTQENLRQKYNELLTSDLALQETSHYLENLINIANAPIIVWDPQFRIIRFNHAFEKVTGKPADSVLGQTLEILFPENYREESMNLIRKANAGERLEAVEIPILHVNGGIRTILWNSATLFSPDRKSTISTIAQGQDITERKKAEETLKESAENLKRSNEDLERFAYVASHDLREPLRMVTSFSQLLERNYKGKLDNDADEFIHYIVDGGTRMDALVNDLLEYSRITSQMKPIEPTDMNAVVRDALHGLAISIHENKAKIHIDMLPVVSVDRLQMTLMFQNLLSNALKFRGGDAPEITISAVRQNEDWVFSVKDNGIGIESDYSEKIFQIFQRLHTREQYPGTGIGLAICRRIVERHGGRIWVESVEGKGSTFFFTIPGEKNG